MKCCQLPASLKPIQRWSGTWSESRLPSPINTLLTDPAQGTFGGGTSEAPPPQSLARIDISRIATVAPCALCFLIDGMAVRKCRCGNYIHPSPKPGSSKVLFRGFASAVLFSSHPMVPRLECSEMSKRAAIAQEIAE